MKQKYFIFGAVFGFAIYVAASFGAGCLSPIVGLDCESGFSECSGLCVDLETDTSNCGTCGDPCSGTCISGFCDTDPVDAATDSDPTDAAPIDGTPIDSPPDGAEMCDGGGWDCGGVCVDWLTDDNNCGGCGNTCTGGLICIGGSCTPDCTLPEVPCGLSCVDRDSDPDNCGTCGNVCSSGICTSGACIGGATGHVVVIGHDYENSRTGMNRLMGNSVFIAQGAPVRVLAFEGAASAAAINGTDAAINQVATEIGRSWSKTVVTAPNVPSQLTTHDVFVIYAQTASDNTTLNQLGTDWTAALNTFISNGGTIVLLEGGGTHDGTYQILDTAGLFTATSRSVITGVLNVVSPGNQVANGVDPMYASEVTTVEFVTAEPDVVVSEGAEAVVVHKVF